MIDILDRGGDYKFEEIMVEKCFNLAKDPNCGFDNPKRVNVKKSTPRYNIIKLLRTKDKLKNLERRERKTTLYLQRIFSANDRGLLT